MVENKLVLAGSQIFLNFVVESQNLVENKLVMTGSMISLNFVVEVPKFGGK